MRPTAFVVMEPGAEWPSWVVREDVDVVAVRGPGPDGGTLTRAVGDRVARVGRPLSLAVLACNAQTDDEATARRVAITRMLLPAVLEVERGHLIINAAGRSSSALRHQLIGLTGTISEGLHGSSSCVSLRFGGAACLARVVPQSAIPPRLHWVTAPAVA
jgi:hypothetical protein